MKLLCAERNATNWTETTSALQQQQDECDYIQTNYLSHVRKQLTHAHEAIDRGWARGDCGWTKTIEWSVSHPNQQTNNEPINKNWWKWCVCETKRIESKTTTTTDKLIKFSHTSFYQSNQFGFTRFAIICLSCSFDYTRLSLSLSLCLSVRVSLGECSFAKIECHSNFIAEIEIDFIGIFPFIHTFDVCFQLKEGDSWASC